jgi:hypothetical protein
MRYKGIHIQDGFPCFLTIAHTEKEVDLIVQRFEETVDELTSAGFFASATGKQAEADKHKVHEKPPVPGARLGRDKEGNPAWFIMDPSDPGKYIKLSI